jgi:hypothetical protein
VLWICCEIKLRVEEIGHGIEVPCQGPIKKCRGKYKNDYQSAMRIIVCCFMPDLVEVS